MGGITAGARALCISAALAAAAGPAFAAELCGRPQEPPQAMYERLTKTEKLAENFRDKSYVAIGDTAKDTVWTFTVPGHPAHPSVVCRRPVKDGDRMRLEMNVQCNAAEAECKKLVGGFQELNQRMLRDMEKQKK
jgi:hypothetical protein